MTRGLRNRDLLFILKGKGWFPSVISDLASIRSVIVGSESRGHLVVCGFCFAWTAIATQKVLLNVTVEARIKACLFLQVNVNCFFKLCQT